MASKRGPSDSAWLRGYRSRRQDAASRAAENGPNYATRAIAEARVKTSNFISRLMMAFVGFAAFCFFTLLSPDRLMIEAKPSLNMPFAGTVSFLAFMMVAPAVLIGMRVYLWAYLQRWRELDGKLGPDSEPKTISPLKHPLLQIFSWIAIYPMLPALLAMFTWKAAAKDWLGEVFLVLTLLCALVSFVLIVRWRWNDSSALFILVPCALFVVLYHEGGLPHRGLHLAREDFKEAYLPGVNLRNAIVTSADLTGADLSSANLVQADLSGANLTAANLSFADLTDADLTGANLMYADLSGIRVPSTFSFDPGIQWMTTLTGAHFTRADLTGADLTGADLAVADLTGVNFQGAKNIPDLSRACADPDDPPKNLPNDVKRPEFWPRCERFFWSMF